MGVVFEIIVEKIVSIVQEYSSRVYQRRIGVGFESIVKEYSQEDWEYIKDIDELNAEFSQFTAVLPSAVCNFRTNKKHYGKYQHSVDISIFLFEK